MIPDPRTQPTMSVELYAQLVGVSRGVAYAAARAGQIPGVFRVGNRWIVPTAAVLRALYLNDDDTE